MNRLAVLTACLLFAFAAHAQGTAAIQYHCYQGGTQAKVSGLSSTNYQLGIVPSCTVTVYLTGTTTKATIFANASGTALSNPFTANAAGSLDPGGWIFWSAVNTGYDIVLSGGIAPNTYATPVTLTDRYPSFSFSGGGGSVTPCGSIGQIQIANAAGTAVNCDPNFLINALTHTRNSTANDVVNAVTSVPRAVYDPMDTKFDGGLAAAVAGTSGFTPTQVINATADYAYCQTKTTRAKAGWIITPPWIINADGVKLWPNQRLGGESTAMVTYFGHSPVTAPMISFHSNTDTITCNGTPYTPGTPVGNELGDIAISGNFTGAQDIGIYAFGFSTYVHDILGWGVAFGRQAVWISGTSAHGERLGTPGSQLAGCQDLATNCYAVQLDNLDGNADYIYSSDGATALTGKGPGPCYPNCGAIGVNGSGSTADNLFAQQSDIGIVVNGTSVRGHNWRTDATSMEGVLFPLAGGGAGVWDIKAQAPCQSAALQSNYNAGTATGCYGVHGANPNGGGNTVMDISAGANAFFGNSYMQCSVGDDANSGAGASNIWGLVTYQGNPGNATSNDWGACGTNNQAASARWLFYNAGAPILASTATINMNGIRAVWLSSGLTVTNWTGGNGGQHINISASPLNTATLAVTGNFRSCSGLPVTVTNDNPVEAVVNAFTGRLDMICNPPNPTPWHVNYAGNTAPTNQSLIDVIGNVQAHPAAAFSIGSAVQLHGATTTGQACFEQESDFADTSRVVSALSCTNVDLATMTPGEIFVTTIPQTTPTLWLVSNSEPSAVAIGKFAAPTGGFWNYSLIALGGDGTTAPPASDNNTGEHWNLGTKGVCPNPLPTCTAEYQSVLCDVPGSGGTADVLKMCSWNGSAFAWVTH